LLLLAVALHDAAGRALLAAPRRSCRVALHASATTP
jgi:hypothetical protein